MQRAYSEAAARPLVVDLDGTLIKTDLLLESFFSLLRSHPLRALCSLAALRHGKAAFKARLAEESALELNSIPFNAQLVDLLRSEKARGRKIYLASGSDRGYVEKLASRVGLFDGAYGSDGAINMSGARKAQELCRMFGAGGFDYAGNSKADLHVWERSHDALVVRAPAYVIRKARQRFANVHILDSAWPRLHDYARALRIHQWVKNLLIFLPAVMAHKFGAELLVCLAAFMSFSLCASSTYLLNDLLDLHHDRAHPSKRNRPLAAGTVPLMHGITLTIVLFSLAMLIALALNWQFVLVLGGYGALTVAYSLLLKREPIVDVVALACLYGARLLAGSAAAAVPLSPWLGALAIFLFLSLALVKRCTELIDTKEEQKQQSFGRGYRAADLPVLESMAAAAGYLAVLVLALYLNSATVIELYGHPQLLWLSCVVLVFWISRVLLLTHRGEMHDDPVVFAATDRISQTCAGAILAIMFAAL